MVKGVLTGFRSNKCDGKESSNDGKVNEGAARGREVDYCIEGLKAFATPKAQLLLSTNKSCYYVDLDSINEV